TGLNEGLPRLWERAKQVNPEFHMTSVSARLPHLASDGTVEGWSSRVTGQPERFVSNHEIVSETATHNDITSHDDLIRLISERLA
ncbi:MAG: hypothetical protein H7123_06205, partial [Thermoleophilia bacterium]|nr:hypothetical protein [Thermoleophilia bacterium]